MDPAHAFRKALALLGQAIDARGDALDVVVIGGGALLLKGLVERPSEDIDILARVDGERWQDPRPLSDALLRDIRDVGRVLGLAVDDTHGMDWFNAGPGFLTTTMLPHGMLDRCHLERFDALTVRLPDRRDLIALKLLAGSQRPRPRLILRCSNSPLGHVFTTHSRRASSFAPRLNRTRNRCQA